MRTGTYPLDEHAPYPLRDQSLPAGAFVPFRKSEIDQSIPSRFESIVSLHAEKAAVRFDGKERTYRDLNARANSIARTLVSLLGSKSEPVALLVGQGTSLIAAILAILKAGKLLVIILEPLLFLQAELQL